jgi:hypothetical protein
MPAERRARSPASSLDAIHIAAARVFGDALRAVVTYDDRIPGLADSQRRTPEGAPLRDS